MTPKQLRTVAELGLIRSIPDNTKSPEKNGRLKGLYKKLQKAVDQKLQTLPRPTFAEVNRIEGIYLAFGKATGWEKKTRHIGTLASFCLGDGVLVSNKDYSPKINSILMDIVDYFDRANKINGLTYAAGCDASEKWAGLFFKHGFTKL
jgi:hypothetical protein